MYRKLETVTSFKYLGSQPDTLQDSTDDSSYDKVETSMEWQKYLSQFQNTTDVTSIYLYTCESYQSCTFSADLQRRI